MSSRTWLLTRQPKWIEIGHHPAEKMNYAAWTQNAEEILDILAKSSNDREIRAVSCRDPKGVLHVDRPQRIHH